MLRGAPKGFGSGSGGEAGPAISGISRDRKHGDPFPLPVLRTDNPIYRGLTFDMSGLPNSHLRLVNEAIRSANALAGACMNAEKACNTSLAQAGWEPTSVQSGILSDLVARLSDVGEPPEGLREEDALRDLAGASYLYGEANHLAEFDPDKIKIFTRALTPTEARDLYSPEVETN